MKLVAAAFVLGAACVLTPVQALAQWEPVNQTDQMTGEVTVGARVRASLEIEDMLGQRERPRLTVFCQAGRRLFVSVAFRSRLFTGHEDTYAMVRMDDEPPANSRWDTTTSGRAMLYSSTEAERAHEILTAPSLMEMDMSKYQAALIGRIIGGQALHLQITPQGVASQYTRFNLTGAREALEPVLAACGRSDLPNEQPS